MIELVIPKKSILLIFFVLCVFLVNGVSAQMVSFAQPDSLTESDIYLYYANGTLQGLYNTSSVGIVIPEDSQGDFLFVLKPHYDTPFDAPADALVNGLAFLETYWIQIGIAVFLIGLFFAGSRR